MHALVPAIRLIIAGATHVGQVLADLAHRIGYDVIVVDPRAAFATEERFGETQTVNAWPEVSLATLGLDARTAVVALTHAAHIDDEALATALRSPCLYIGALGSKRTHANRMERLKRWASRKPILPASMLLSGLPSARKDLPRSLSQSWLRSSKWRTEESNALTRRHCACGRSIGAVRSREQAVGGHQADSHSSARWFGRSSAATSPRWSSSLDGMRPGLRSSLKGLPARHAFNAKWRVRHGHVDCRRRCGTSSQCRWSFRGAGRHAST